MAIRRGLRDNKLRKSMNKLISKPGKLNLASTVELQLELFLRLDSPYAGGHHE